ncbi:YkgJ family cysteine cluster protein [bacterium]|nr:YkgJ family cysteine cluster protein [bacterium]
MLKSLRILTSDLCSSCNGACCRTTYCPPLDSYGTKDQNGLEDWLTSIPGHLRERVREAHQEFANGKRGPCIWLTEDGICEHYDYRPIVCRHFKPGEDGCLEFRIEAGIDPAP